MTLFRESNKDSGKETTLLQTVNSKVEDYKINAQKWLCYRYKQ